MTNLDDLLPMTRAGYVDAKYCNLAPESFDTHASRENYKYGRELYHKDQAAEGTETVIDGAKKYDVGKAPVMQGCIQRFPLALQQVALVSNYGRRKYGTFYGWENLDDAINRYNDALGRHALLAKSEGAYDVGDSGLPHVAQVAWNALAVLELALRDGSIEMTPGNDIEDGKPILGSNGRSNDA